MKRVQNEKKATRKKGKPKRVRQEKKCNMNRVQHKATYKKRNNNNKTQKKCNVKRVHIE